MILPNSFDRLVFGLQEVKVIGHLYQIINFLILLLFFAAKYNAKIQYAIIVI